MRTSNIENLIQKHRPRPGTENQLCRDSMLHHLNRHGLMARALREQLIREGRDPAQLGDAPPTRITKIVAWEVLAEAQRRGLRLTPRMEKPLEAGPPKRGPFSFLPPNGEG